MRVNLLFLLAAVLLVPQFLCSSIYDEDQLEADSPAGEALSDEADEEALDTLQQKWWLVNHDWRYRRSYWRWLRRRSYRRPAVARRPVYVARRPVANIRTTTATQVAVPLTTPSPSVQPPRAAIALIDQTGFEDDSD